MPQRGANRGDLGYGRQLALDRSRNRIQRPISAYEGRFDNFPRWDRRATTENAGKRAPYNLLGLGLF
jgi:hypothetical protein